MENLVFQYALLFKCLGSVIFLYFYSGVGMQRLTGFTINRALKRHG